MPVQFYFTYGVWACHKQPGIASKWNYRSSCFRVYQDL